MRLGGQKYYYIMTPEAASEIMRNIESVGVYRKCHNWKIYEEASGRSSHQSAVEIPIIIINYSASLTNAIEKPNLFQNNHQWPADRFWHFETAAIRAEAYALACGGILELRGNCFVFGAINSSMISNLKLVLIMSWWWLTAVYIIT